MQILEEEMGGQAEWLLRNSETPFYHFLPSLIDAPAWLNPQGILRLLLSMESQSNTPLPNSDRFFLKHFDSLPADRADRVLKLATGSVVPMTAAERHLLGKDIITALLTAGMTKRAWDAAKALMVLYAESDLIGLPQQSTSMLSPLQLQIRSLLLRAAWERLGPTGSHVESFGEAFRTMAFSASTDFARDNYHDWSRQKALANPEEVPRILKSLPAPRTCRDLSRDDLKWTYLDGLSWRSVTWSLGPYGWHDERRAPSVDGKPVRFQMPYHSALVERLGWQPSAEEAIKACMGRWRHLEPAEVPRISAAARTYFENRFCNRLPGSELLTLKSDSHAAYTLEALLPLISSLFLSNTREAFSWTLDLARMAADKYPNEASKLLDQVPFDIRDAHPEWEMARPVPGSAPNTAAAPGLLVKDALALADSLQILRVSVGLRIDELGEIKVVDASAPSSVEYRQLLLYFIKQSQQIERPLPPEKCLHYLEAAVGLLQQMRCKDPLALITQIIESEETEILRLIGDGRISCRLDPCAAPDLCGIRVRLQLPADITPDEVEWVDAFVTTLLWASEPAGMSLLHELVCKEGLGMALRSRIIGDVLKFWEHDAPRKAGDRGWAGLLLVLEHHGLITDAVTKDGADGLRRTLLRRWREGKGGQMPLTIAMGLLSSQLAAGDADQETLPALETLFLRSRQQPEAYAHRIAMWVMRRLHDLDGNEARRLESDLRSKGALRLVGDMRQAVEYVLNEHGVRDPRRDALPSDNRDMIGNLVTLWAASAPNPVDGSMALQHLDQSFRPIGPKLDSKAIVIQAATFARVGLALPGDNPDSRLLADRWVALETQDDIHSAMRADIAYAFLRKFAKERLPFTAKLADEWRIAGKLESMASDAVIATYPQLELADYLVGVFRDGKSAFFDDVTLERAVSLCEKWKAQCPDWYKIMLPVTKAAVQRMKPREWLVSRAKQRSSSLSLDFVERISKLEED